jgi:hypothetical protein
LAGIMSDTFTEYVVLSDEKMVQRDNLWNDLGVPPPPDAATSEAVRADEQRILDIEGELLRLRHSAAVIGGALSVGEAIATDLSSMATLTELREADPHRLRELFYSASVLTGRPEGAKIRSAYRSMGVLTTKKDVQEQLGGLTHGVVEVCYIPYSLGRAARLLQARMRTLGPGQRDVLSAQEFRYTLGAKPNSTYEKTTIGRYYQRTDSSPLMVHNRTNSKRRSLYALTAGEIQPVYSAGEIYLQSGKPNPEAGSLPNEPDIKRVVNRLSAVHDSVSPGIVLSFTPRAFRFMLLPDGWWDSTEAKGWVKDVGVALREVGIGLSQNGKNGRAARYLTERL